MLTFIFVRIDLKKSLSFRILRDMKYPGYETEKVELK